MADAEAEESMTTCLCECEELLCLKLDGRDLELCLDASESLLELSISKVF